MDLSEDVEVALSVAHLAGGGESAQSSGRDARVIARMVNNEEGDDVSSSDDDDDEDDSSFVPLEEEHLQLAVDNSGKQQQSVPSKRHMEQIDSVHTLLDTATDPKKRNCSPAQKILQNDVAAIQIYILGLRDYFEHNVPREVGEKFTREQERLREEIKLRSLMEEEEDEFDGMLPQDGAAYTESVNDGADEEDDDDDDDDDEEEEDDDDDDSDRGKRRGRQQQRKKKQQQRRRTSSATRSTSDDTSDSTM